MIFVRENGPFRQTHAFATPAQREASNREMQAHFRRASQKTPMTTAVIHGEGPALNLSGRIPELDGLRGIAIGMVLIWHSSLFPATSPISPRLVPGLLTWTGVDLFFVLSGFLIGGILLDARTSTNYFQVSIPDASFASSRSMPLCY